MFGRLVGWMRSLFATDRYDAWQLTTQGWMRGRHRVACESGDGLWYVWVRDQDGVERLSSGPYSTPLVAMNVANGSAGAPHRLMVVDAGQGGFSALYWGKARGAC